MGITGDGGEEKERQEGGWQSQWQPGGWQSQWQQPGSEAGWRQEAPPAPAQPTSAGWYQTPDGRWAQAGPTTSGKSTAALILGILGLVFCPLICSVLALVFGYQARNEIDGSGGRIGGRGNAKAGIVLGWIGVAICAVFVLLVIIGIAFGDSPDGGTVGGTPA